MPASDGSVGQGAQNQRHDVAVVQAALGKARGPGCKPFWPGPIDGDYPRHRRALDQSIAVFQQAHRLRPSGKMNRLGSDVDRLETALPASHRRMSGVPGTVLVRRRNTAAPAPAAEAAARTEATAPLPDVERAALAALQRDLFEAHRLYFKVTGVGVVAGGRFQVSLAWPDSEWLDARRNVFELGGKLPPALRKGLEATIRGAARAWKLAPAPGGQPGLALISTLAHIALRAGAAPKRKDLDALGISQVPGEPTARACLAACVDLILSGEAQTPAGRKQVEELAQAIAVLYAHTAQTLLAAAQTAEAGGPSQQSQQQWVNPTGGTLRGTDPLYGDGTFGASRRRKNGTVYSHEGQDYLATMGQDVVAVTAGVVSKIGFPYINDTHYKYVEITTANNVRVRHLYVDPASGIVVGAPVVTGTVIGTYQSLQPKLPGIHEHVHMEVLVGGVPVDPRQFIP